MAQIFMAVLAIGAIIVAVMALCLFGTVLAMALAFPYFSSFLIIVGLCSLGGPIGFVFGLGMTVVVWSVLAMCGVKFGSDSSCSACDEALAEEGREMCKACGINRRCRSDTR